METTTESRVASELERGVLVVGRSVSTYWASRRRLRTTSRRSTTWKLFVCTTASTPSVQCRESENASCVLARSVWDPERMVTR